MEEQKQREDSSQTLAPPLHFLNPLTLPLLIILKQHFLLLRNCPDKIFQHGSRDTYRSKLQTSTPYLFLSTINRRTKNRKIDRLNFLLKAKKRIIVEWQKKKRERKKGKKKSIQVLEGFEKWPIFTPRLSNSFHGVGEVDV